MTIRKLCSTRIVRDLGSKDPFHGVLIHFKFELTVTAFFEETLR
jgi:hypothetical protein